MKLEGGKKGGKGDWGKGKEEDIPLSAELEEKKRNLPRMSQPYCYQYQDAPVGKAARLTANGYPTCGRKFCNMVHQVIDKDSPDWEIALKHTAMYDAIKDYKNEVRRSRNGE